MTSGVAVPTAVLTATNTIFTLTVTNQAKRSLTITVLGFGTTSSPMVEARAGHTATLLADATVLLAGGEIGGGSLASP